MYVRKEDDCFGGKEFNNIKGQEPKEGEQQEIAWSFTTKSLVTEAATVIDMEIPTYPRDETGPEGRERIKPKCRLDVKTIAEEVWQ